MYFDRSTFSKIWEFSLNSEKVWKILLIRRSPGFFTFQQKSFDYKLSINFCIKIRAKKMFSFNLKRSSIISFSNFALISFLFYSIACKDFFLSFFFLFSILSFLANASCICFGNGYWIVLTLKFQSWAIYNKILFQFFLHLNEQLSIWSWCSFVFSL